MANHLEKETVERILNSKHFRGKKIRHVLEYLCNVHWKEPGRRVTQYDIAQELYGSTDDTGTVRVTVSKVRERLALFYAEENRACKLKLEIPTGKYEVVFSKLEVPATSSPMVGAGPSGTEKVTDKNSGRFGRPGFLIISVIVILLLVGTIVTVKMRSPETQSDPERSAVEPVVLAAIDVVPKGSEIIGTADGGIEVWGPIRLQGPVRGIQKLSIAEQQYPYFLVAYGGCGPRGELDPWCAPQAVILSATGIQLGEPIDLLGEFNPFDGLYKKELFELITELRQMAPTDLDGDGYEDGILYCRHEYFPSIFYFISGKNHVCMGAFANSGVCLDVVNGPGPPEGNSIHRSVGILGMNNRMGHQHVFFVPAWDSMSVSPDILSKDYGNGSYYRPIGNIDWTQAVLSATPDGLFLIADGQVNIRFNSLAFRNEDPWFGDGLMNTAAVERIRDQYGDIRRARELVQKGQIELGMALYEEARESDLADPPMKYYVVMDMVNALKQAGKPHRALQWLPREPGEQLNPGSVAYCRGELLLLVKKPGEAAAAFFDALSHSDQHGRYKQYTCARILEGLSIVDLYRDLQTKFSRYIRYPMSRAWLVLPGLLQGDVGQARKQIESLDFAMPRLEDDEEPLFYPLEHAFWTALADLEEGLPISVQLDETPELAAPAEQQEMTELYLELFRATREHFQGDRDRALDLLSASYGKLRDVSGRESRAILPFIYAAFRFGFAALEEPAIKGDAREAELKIEARHALEQAVSWYGHGEWANKARQHLAATEDYNPPTSSTSNPA